MSSSNIINMDKINKFYDDFHVLKNINFYVKKGEIVVVCGPSGSGKSTLIRCINGLEDIDDGQIVVDEIDIHASKKNLQEIRGEVGMVFQHFNLFPHLTILENITLAPGLVKKVKKEDAETCVLFELIAERYESKSLIITANQPFAQWDTIFPDNMMAVAAIDRLVHHATIINIEGQSFRKTNAKNNQQLSKGEIS